MPTIPKPKPKTKPQGGSLKEIRRSIYNTRRWQALRLTHLKAYPLCAICLEEGRTTEANHVHHIKTFTDAPTRSERCAIAYDPDNLESLCAECHAKLHGRRGAVKERERKKKTTEEDEQAPTDRGGQPTAQGGRGSNLRAAPPVNPARFTSTQPEVFEVFGGSENYDTASREDSADQAPAPKYTPPTGLTHEAHEAVRSIAEALEGQDAVTRKDHTALNILALTLDRYERANSVIRREGELVFTRSGKPMRHPLIKVATDAQIQAVKLLSEFGLTPKSRERIKAMQTKTDEADSLTEFLTLMSKR